MRRALTPLRWAQGQGEHGHGTKYHLVVADIYDNSEGYGFPEQRCACGVRIVQSCDLPLGDWQEVYLDNGSPAWDVCPKCKFTYLATGRTLNRTYDARP